MTGSSTFCTFLGSVISKTLSNFYKSFSKLSLFSDCIFLVISRSVFYNTFCVSWDIFICGFVAVVSSFFISSWFFITVSNSFDCLFREGVFIGWSSCSCSAIKAEAVFWRRSTWSRLNCGFSGFKFLRIWVFCNWVSSASCCYFRLVWRSSWRDIDGARFNSVLEVAFWIWWSIKSSFVRVFKVFN